MLEQQLFEEILKLPPSTRANFAERILASLESPEDLILHQWAEEAESRIKAYESGLIETIPAEEMFAKYKLQ
jgi:putative addiction module component (TIGR02574 family)